jgi:vacuolar protein sorting-associated protein 54
MSSRAIVHVNAMKKIDWDAQVDTQTVSPYMETLTKETGTLRRVLSKHLPEATVMIIMNPVFLNYKDQWTKAFQSVTLKTEGGRQRWASVSVSTFFPKR